MKKTLCLLAFMTPLFAQADDLELNMGSAYCYDFQNNPLTVPASQDQWLELLIKIEYPGGVKSNNPYAVPVDQLMVVAKALASSTEDEQKILMVPNSEEPNCLSIMKEKITHVQKQLGLSEPVESSITPITQ